MYMADKPLVQENLADNIAKLIEEFKNSSQIFLFIEAAFETFVREWNGIDKFRMDKFMMLFTRFLRQSLVYLKLNKWKMDEVGKFVKLMETTIICPSDKTNLKPLGLKMHLTDVLLDELAKVGRECLPNDVTITFLYPFFKVLVVCRQVDFIKYVESKIFGSLIRMSDLGIQNQDHLAIGEFEVVKEDKKKEEMEEVTEEEEPLDPRAGGVDVYIPQIKPNYAQIADIMTSLGGIAEINQSKRNLLYKYVNIFLDLEMGVYPYSKLNGKFETFEPKPNMGIEHKKEGEDPADVNSFQKLKLGDNGICIKKNRKFWNRLQKKSEEEKRKEVKKGYFNSEFVVNNALYKLAVRKQIPINFYITSAPLQNSSTKKRKNKTAKKVEVVSDNLAKPAYVRDENKEVSLANNVIASFSQNSSKSSVEKKRRLKRKTLENIDSHILKDKLKNCENNMKENLNLKLNKIGLNLLIEKSDEGKLGNDVLSVNTEGKFETKSSKQSTVNGDFVNDSLEIETASGQGGKSSVEKRKRKRKVSKSSSINNTAIENVKHCTNISQKENKIKICSEEIKEVIPVKTTLTGIKKTMIEAKNVKQSKVKESFKKSLCTDLETVLVSGQVEKSSGEKKKKTKRKISRSTSLNNSTTENVGLCTSKMQRKDKINICSEKFHEVIPNALNESSYISLRPVTVSGQVEKKKKKKSNSNNSSINNSVIGNVKQWTNKHEEMPNKPNLIRNMKPAKAKGSSSINMVIKTQKMNTKGKLLKINLRENTIHDVVHYNKILSSSPGIPFSANKKPRASVLKATPPTNGRKKPKKLKRLQDLARKF